MIVPNTDRELIKHLSSTEFKNLKVQYFDFCLSLGIDRKFLKMYKRVSGKTESQLCDEFRSFCSGWISGLISSANDLSVKSLPNAYVDYCYELGQTKHDIKMYVVVSGSLGTTKSCDFMYFSEGWLRSHG